MFPKLRFIERRNYKKYLTNKRKIGGDAWIFFIHMFNKKIKNTWYVLPFKLCPIHKILLAKGWLKKNSDSVFAVAQTDKSLLKEFPYVMPITKLYLWPSQTSGNSEFKLKKDFLLELCLEEFVFKSIIAHKMCTDSALHQKPHF